MERFSLVIPFFFVKKLITYDNYSNNHFYLLIRYLFYYVCTEINLFEKLTFRFEKAYQT